MKQKVQQTAIRPTAHANTSLMTKAAERPRPCLASHTVPSSLLLNSRENDWMTKIGW